MSFRNEQEPYISKTSGVLLKQCPKEDLKAGGLQMKLEEE